MFGIFNLSFSDQYKIPLIMNKLILFSLLCFSTAGLFAQEYRLPISDQDAFLGNTSTFIESLTIGQLVPVSKLKHNPFFGRDSVVSDWESKKKIEPGVGLRIGYSWRDMSFDDNMIFEDENGDLLMQVNDDPTVLYPSRLFRNGYTRLRGGYFRIGAGVGLVLFNAFQISTGLNVDLRVFSQYKNKAFVDDNKVVNKLKGNELLQLNGQQYSWVIQGGFQGLSFCYEMSLNDFFKESWGLDYQFSSFGVVYGF